MDPLPRAYHQAKQASYYYSCLKHHDLANTYSQHSYMCDNIIQCNYIEVKDIFWQRTLYIYTLAREVR